MAWEGNEKTKIRLGHPYAFTRSAYEYCANTKKAPVAVIYYDTKTSAPSKELLSSVFSKPDEIKSLKQTLNSDAQPFNGGYCVLMVLDRRGIAYGHNADAKFFVDSVLKDASGSDDARFVSLVISYNGKKACHRLADGISGGNALAQDIRLKCESGVGGVSAFSSWSGRQDWISHTSKMPDSETASTKNLDSASLLAVGVPPYWKDPPAKKKYADYDPGQNGSFSGIGAAPNRDGQGAFLNLADIATPETTYLLMGSYDQNHPDDCPTTCIAAIKPYVQDHCDKIIETWNTECHSGYKGKFQDGAKYRFFIFYEFSHGGVHSITIGIKYEDVWNTFSRMTSRQRVFGIFDSCHGGSILEHDGASYKPFSAAAPASAQSQNGESIDVLEYIDRKLNRRAVLMEAVTQGQVTQAAAAATYNPRMALWSCTGPFSYGWYQHGSNTAFTVGMADAMESQFWDGEKHSRIRYGYGKPQEKIKYSPTSEKNNWLTNYYKPRFQNPEGSQAFFQIQKKGRRRKGSKINKETASWPDDPLDACLPMCRYYPENDSFNTNIIFY